MGRIRILPESVVNQIAAGEVIERPASVLKELLENSIDAGSSKIQVTCRRFGSELIHVVDDGCGMNRDDLLLAFERHATSKLREAEELQNVRTLGFRGEALPSIASVSVVEARTRSEGESAGTMIRVEAGNIVHEEPSVAPRGTSIYVQSLFYNTPARVRFLKSPSTELAHLVKVFRQYAIAYPGLHLTFAHDDSSAYSFPTADFAVRLDDMFGSGFSGKTYPVEFDQGGIRISGVLGKPELAKRSRGDQYVYLSQRPVQNSVVHSAVRAALSEQLGDGEWPFYVLLLEIEPGLVDVNVHPAKLEVRFADERVVHGAIFRALRRAMEKYSPVADLRQAQQDPAAGLRESLGAGSAFPSQNQIRERLQAIGGMDHPSLAFPQMGATVPLPPVPREQEGLFRPAIYQLHKKYLVSQIRSGIAVIDQHAAHERILYERALRSFQERMFNSQQLLFPLLLDLDEQEDAVFQEFKGDLGVLGFQVREFGARSYVVDAVPAGLKRSAESGMLRSMIEEYKEFRRADFRPRDALAASFACHSAIRTGDSLTPEEMTALVDELFSTQFPLICPHGRPTVIEIKLNELDQRFKRTD